MNTYKLTGIIADAGELESSGEAIAIFKELECGLDHTLIINTYKHNCGAYQIDCRCSCGQIYFNGMNGCWQWSHQREEENEMNDCHHEYVKLALKQL